MKAVMLQIILILFTSILFTPDAIAADDERELASWDFDVYLDDKKVGKHRFELSQKGSARQLQSEASFKVKFLFVTAYSYKHSASERWSDDCLVKLDATTNTNGKRNAVSGEKSGLTFVVDDDNSVTELPECVMTFAYWNPAFLERQRLLNPQTGEFLDVSVENQGTDSLQVRGSTVAATRFKLTAANIDVTLWYSTSNEWLALESVAKGSRIIRYELS